MIQHSLGSTLVWTEIDENEPTCTEDLEKMFSSLQKPYNESEKKRIFNIGHLGQTALLLLIRREAKYITI